MVGVTGFEPATPTSRTFRANTVRVASLKIVQHSIGNSGNVCVSEVISLKQQRLACNFRERIAEAVAEIKTCRMPALAVATPGLTSRIGLVCGDGLYRQTSFRN
jgi:hypothetical protein